MEQEPQSTKHAGIHSLTKALDSGVEGYTNWHTVSATFKGVIDGLSRRSLEELIGSLKELDNEALPGLSGDIGADKTTLDLPSVGSVKKVAAMVFSRWFPAFMIVVRRAESRDEARARLKSYEGVLVEMREFRKKLSEEVDNLLELRLKETNPEVYAECKRIAENVTKIKFIIERIKDLRAKYNLEKISGSPHDRWGDKYFNAMSYYKAYDSVYFQATGNHLTPGESGITAYPYYLSGESVNQIMAIEIILPKDLARLQNQRNSILARELEALSNSKS